MRRAMLVSLALLFMSAAVHAGLNSDAIYSMRLNMILSGSIVPAGNTDHASLMLYIPQEGIRSLQVSGPNWSYAYDEFGNIILNLTWRNINSRTDYSIAIVLENTAKHLYNERPVGSSSAYLGGNISAAAMALAQPYEKSLKKAALLAEFVHDYMTYDSSVAGNQKNVDWVIKNRRGVCAEYSRLLVELLRANGIPARYVNGYAYSEQDKKMIGHTWVQVLLEDGSWTEIDPTRLQMGYIDATHIRTAVLADPNQTEILEYYGSGALRWDRNEDVTEIISYQMKNITAIKSEPLNFTTNSNGSISAAVSTGECQIVRITASSCATLDGKDMLNITNADINRWTCSSSTFYWNFTTSELDERYSYKCPVSIYTQRGEGMDIDITLKPAGRPAENNTENYDNITAWQPEPEKKGFLDELFSVITDFFASLFGSKK
jgi:hypothetical protein